MVCICYNHDPNFNPPPPPPQSLTMSPFKQARNITFWYSGATFHIPLTKSAILNRLLHCNLWQFSGALFFSSRALFCISGAKSAGAPCVIFPCIQGLFKPFPLTPPFMPSTSMHHTFEHVTAVPNCTRFVLSSTNRQQLCETLAMLHGLWQWMQSYQCTTAA